MARRRFPPACVGTSMRRAKLAWTSATTGSARSSTSQGLAWTRENFIKQKYAGEYPEEWDESDLPNDLQDWTAGRPEPTRE